jgi:endonuclease/exonuclease/phosphatase family metal-dependent hydrolase
MKIATYNLRLGGKKDRRIHWEQIFQTISPDIFLVQETCEPNAYIADDGSDNWQQRVHWVPVPGMKWGSAIYAKSGRVTPIAIPAEFQGAVVGVDLDDFAAADGKVRSLCLFSIHAQAPYKKSVNAILDFIADHFKDRELLIGGDFNLTTGIRHPEEFELGDPWLIERFRKEFNLLSCWQAANPNRSLPQTLRHGDKTKPFHCDGIFVPAAWYGDLAQSEVLSAPIWDELSDHNPVFAEFLCVRSV